MERIDVKNGGIRQFIDPSKPPNNGPIKVDKDTMTIIFDIFSARLSFVVMSETIAMITGCCPLNTPSRIRANKIISMEADEARRTKATKVPAWEMNKIGFLPCLSLNLPQIGPKIMEKTAFALVMMPTMMSLDVKVLVIVGNNGNVKEYPSMSTMRQIIREKKRARSETPFPSRNDFTDASSV